MPKDQQSRSKVAHWPNTYELWIQNFSLPDPLGDLCQKYLATCVCINASLRVFPGAARATKSNRRCMLSPASLQRNLMSHCRFNFPSRLMPYLLSMLCDAVHLLRHTPGYKSWIATVLRNSETINNNFVIRHLLSLPGAQGKSLPGSLSRACRISPQSPNQAPSLHKWSSGPNWNSCERLSQTSLILHSCDSFVR